MPRRTTRKRRPTVEDLTPVQRRIYEALPGDDLQQEYLSQLPDIKTSNAGGRKKAQILDERIQLLDSILRNLQNQKRHLEQLQKNLKQGVDPAVVDLRQELKPPAIDGVLIRFVRPRRGGVAESAPEGSA